MSERLCSVGLDVGTTSTQMVVSELIAQNRAGSFAVPEMVISSRRILYRSPVYFTPLLDESRVDGGAIRAIVEEEYGKAGIRREDVDTGAVIITGETSRKENAEAVLSALSEFAGDFVVATAGPDLESVLAAKGAGAPEYSAKTGNRVLHMDIGGGTSNLALIEDGAIVKTGCMNVGGRLIKLDKVGRVLYVSPVLEGLCSLKPGDRAEPEELERIAGLLVRALEMAAGKREPSPLLERLWTRESGAPWHAGGDLVLSFSGGVADCIETERDMLSFGDIGPILGQAIRRSALCAGPYRLGDETIRATVIGAGCHSARLSGSTVFYANVDFPLKNLPVVKLSKAEQALPAEALARCIREKVSRQDGAAVLALPGFPAPSYTQVAALAEGIAQGLSPVYVCVETDMAKALGQAISQRLPKNAACLCLDGVRLEPESFLDVGTPVGPALPVVVKTLILSH